MEEKTLFEAYNDMQQALESVYQRLGDMELFMKAVIVAFKSLKIDVEYLVEADKLPKALKGELRKTPRHFKGITP